MKRLAIPVLWRWPQGKKTLNRQIAKKGNCNLNFLLVGTVGYTTMCSHHDEPRMDLSKQGRITNQNLQDELAICVRGCGRGREREPWIMKTQQIRWLAAPWVWLATTLICCSDVLWFLSLTNPSTSHVFIYLLCYLPWGANVPFLMYSIFCKCKLLFYYILVVWNQLIFPMFFSYHNEHLQKQMLHWNIFPLLQISLWTKTVMFSSWSRLKICYS